MVEAERIKLILTKVGEHVIADVQEAVDKETGDRKAYILTVPYTVQIAEQPESQVDLDTFEDQEVKIRYRPWCPFTIDQRIAIECDYVVSIMDPAPSLLQTYLSNVRAKQGDRYVDDDKE
jgi:hypothetical protein